MRGGGVRRSSSAAPREWQHYSDPLFATVFAATDPRDRRVRDDLARAHSPRTARRADRHGQPTPGGRSTVRGVAKATDSKVPHHFRGDRVPQNRRQPSLVKGDIRLHLSRYLCCGPKAICAPSRSNATLPWRHLAHAQGVLRVGRRRARTLKCDRKPDLYGLDTLQGPPEHPASARQAIDISELKQARDELLDA